MRQVTYNAKTGEIFIMDVADYEFPIEEEIPLNPTLEIELVNEQIADVLKVILVEGVE